MKVQFWVIGKTTDTYLLPGINDYKNRLKRYSQFEYIELPAAKIGKNASEKETKNKEGARQKTALTGCGRHCAECTAWRSESEERKPIH